MRICAFVPISADAEMQINLFLFFFKKAKQKLHLSQVFNMDTYISILRNEDNHWANAINLML